MSDKLTEVNSSGGNSSIGSSADREFGNQATGRTRVLDRTARVIANNPM